MIASNHVRPKLFEFNRLTRFYGTVIGVNDITLDLPIGAYGLVGPNGAGKTTLIDLITGALRPSLGSIRVLGESPQTSRKVVSEIGICPARDLLQPRVSARVWVRHLLQVSGYKRTEADRLACESLEQVGLANAMDRPIGTYSLGMRQRTKVAQAIAHQPHLLILDEPFNGLDPIGRHELTQLFRQWADKGRSVLLASHVLHEVEAVTDAFLLIYGGRLLASGSAGELRSLLSELPQEVTLATEQISALAAHLVDLPGITNLSLDAKKHELTVSIREPMALYEKLLQLSTHNGVVIQRISGADGDLSSLFKALTARHQGQRA